VREPFSTDATVVAPKRSFIRRTQENIFCASMVISVICRSVLQLLQRPQSSPRRQNTARYNAAGSEVMAIIAHLLKPSVFLRLFRVADRLLDQKF
jgi:hypothetical protein